MKSERSPFKTIFIAVVSSTLVLAALSYLLYFHLFPFYGIAIAQVYSVLVRLLPIIIGLILVITAIVISPPTIPQTSDRDDEIPQDEYTAPLFHLPDEQPVSPVVTPAEKVDASPIQDRIIREQLAPVVPVAVQELAEVERPVQTIVEEEVDSLESSEHPFVFDFSLDRPVTFEKYLYPIEEGSDIAGLLEPIKESAPVDAYEYPELYKTVELSLPSILKEELESSKSSNYPLSLASCLLMQSDEQIQNLFRERLELLGVIAASDNGIHSLILPFYSYFRTQKTMADLIGSIKRRAPESRVIIGYTSVDNREATVDSMIEEAHLAFELAREKEGDALIGFEKEEEGL